MSTTSVGALTAQMDGQATAGHCQLGFLLAGLVSCNPPMPRRAVLLGPSRKVSSPLFALLCTLLCGTCLFYLLPTNVKKTNKKQKILLLNEPKTK